MSIVVAVFERQTGVGEGWEEFILGVCGVKDMGDFPERGL
jgi:hypothetical protein